MNTHQTSALLLAAFIVVAQAKAQSYLEPRYKPVVEQEQVKAKAKAKARTKAQHEISAYGMGGYSPLLYKAADVKVSGGVGGGFGLGYTYLLKNNWGLSAGVELLFVGAKAEAQQLSGGFTTTIHEADGTPVDLLFNSRYTGYRERQRATYLNIPITGLWHTHNFSDDLNFYAQAGLKLGLGISGSYTITADELATTGDIPAWLITLPDNPNHNFVTQANFEHTGELSFGFSLSLAAEGGVKWPLAERWSLYTGVYLDYSLLNDAPPALGALVEVPVDQPAAFTYNSLLTAGSNGSGYVDRVGWLSVGVRVRIAFGI